MKRAVNFLKRIAHSYLENSQKYYGPMIKTGINPWMV